MGVLVLTDVPTPNEVCPKESTALYTCQEEYQDKCTKNCLQKLSEFKMIGRSSVKQCEEMKELFLYCGCGVCAVEKDAYLNCHCYEDSTLTPVSAPIDDTSGSRGMLSFLSLLTV